MDIGRVYGWLFRVFRPRRMRRFHERFGTDGSTRILDVGGTPGLWQLVPTASRVTLLNAEASSPDGWPRICGDGRRLPFRDGAFDVAFSNSVIEHVGDLADQRRFAAELRRVARHVWVQTPAWEFPVEPHLLTPAVHWLPAAWRKRLLRNATVWGWLMRPAQADVDRFVDTTRLLTAREMRSLFPDCELQRERVLGLTKAYVAVRGRALAQGGPAPGGSIASTSGASAPGTD